MLALQQFCPLLERDDSDGVSTNHDGYVTIFRAETIKEIEHARDRRCHDGRKRQYRIVDEGATPNT